MREEIKLERAKYFGLSNSCINCKYFKADYGCIEIHLCSRGSKKTEASADYFEAVKKLKDSKKYKTKSVFVRIWE